MREYATAWLPIVKYGEHNYFGENHNYTQFLLCLYLLLQELIVKTALQVREHCITFLLVRFQAADTLTGNKSLAPWMLHLHLTKRYTHFRANDRL